MNTTHDLIQKKNWSVEDFKNSDDIVDRTIWFINSLSPHNLWKGAEALHKIKDEAKREERELQNEYLQKLAWPKEDIDSVNDWVDTIRKHRDSLKEDGGEE